MEVHEALRLFLKMDCAESTRRTYAKVLTRFVEDIGPGRPLELLSPEDLDAYVLKLRRQDERYAEHPLRPAEAGRLASSTVHKHVKTIKRFFNWCVERGYLNQSPGRYLTNRRPVRPLGEGKAATDEEVGEMLSAARYKPRDWAILLLLAQSGARASEIAGLLISNLQLDEGYALVDGKGDKLRRIYFAAESAIAIRGWLAARPKTGHDYVFTSTRGHGPLNAQGVSQIVRRISRVAGLKRELGAHSFRHFVGMKLARSKVSLPVIQQYLGHSDSQITAQYLRSINEDDMHAAGRLLSLIRSSESGSDEEIVRRFRQLG